MRGKCAPLEIPNSEMNESKSIKINQNQSKNQNPNQSKSKSIGSYLTETVLSLTQQIRHSAHHHTSKEMKKKKKS
jgi:hypothetical protein